MSGFYDLCCARFFFMSKPITNLIYSPAYITQLDLIRVAVQAVLINSSFLGVGIVELNIKIDERC